jgi:hypothetical protein
MNMSKNWTVKVAAVLASALLVFGASFAYATGQVVTGSVNMTASFAEVATGGITSNLLSQVISKINTYTNGTGSNQVDTIYAATLSLAATPTTIDLSTLTDPSGASINFARVREFIVQNTDAAAGHDVTLTQGASNGVTFLPATGGIPARYSSIVRISDPVSTGATNGNYVDSTHKTLKLDPGANTIQVLILIVGGSAA